MTKTTKTELTAEQLAAAKAKRSEAAKKAAATRKFKKQLVEAVVANGGIQKPVETEQQKPTDLGTVVKNVVAAVNAKKSSGWIKSAIDYITSQVQITKDVAVQAISHGKKIWITVNGQQIYWLRKQDRADQLLQRLLAL